MLLKSENLKVNEALSAVGSKMRIADRMSFDPTNVGISERLETVGISIALVVHSFNPTKDVISDSAKYTNCRFFNL